MFGVGYQEMFLIMVVALVVFGPGKLPEVAGQVGRAVRDFRRMTADLTGEFEKTIAEVDDVKQSVRKEVKSMRAEVEGVTKSVKDDLEGISDTKAVSAGSTAKKVASAKGSGGRVNAVASTDAAATTDSAEVPTASKADPLADVSALEDGATLPTEPPRPEEGTPLTALNASAEHAATNGADAAPAAGGLGGDREPAGVAPGADDAIARARRRRATAGYRRS